MEKKQPIKSVVLRSGKRTFFFDINLAANNNKYLKITELTIVGEGQPPKRNSFLLFTEDLKNFQEKLNELSSELN